MSQIVQVKSPVLAAVTDSDYYVRARKEANKLSREYDLRVADMPMVIQAMTAHPKVRKAIRPTWIDTITGEYHGQRDGDRSYEIWHSAGSLATAKGLEKAFSKAGDYGFMQIADDEWVAVGKSNYNSQNVARIHLDDVKKGSVPVAGTPYTVFTRLDKDKANINGNSQLNYGAFMSDDRVLMIAGSPESREALAKMLFSKKEDGGEGWSNIGSYHRINKAGFDAQAKGRLVYLGNGNIGLDGNHNIDIYNSYGCFVVVSAVRAKTASSGIVQPTLEQTLAVINNPDLNREDTIKAGSQLYRQ